MVDRNEQSSFNLLSATKLKAIFARLVKEAITHLGYER